LSVHLISSLQRLSSNRRKGRTLFPLDLVFARNQKTAHSLLWFAAIKCLERVKDSAGLAPKGGFVAAETIKREIGQVGETQKATSEFDIGRVGIFSRVGYSFHVAYSTVRNYVRTSGIDPLEYSVNKVPRIREQRAVLPTITQMFGLNFK